MAVEAHHLHLERHPGALLRELLEPRVVLDAQRVDQVEDMPGERVAALLELREVVGR